MNGRRAALIAPREQDRYSTPTACVLIALVAGLAGACSDPVGPGPSLDVTMFVTAALAASLDAQGRLVFKDTITIEVPERVDFRGARELGLAFIRRHWSNDAGTGLRYTLEQQRGRQIELSALTSEARVHWAHSPYYGLPDSAPLFLRKRSSPYALVRLAENSLPAINVAVSALNTDYEVGDDGGLSSAPVPDQGEGFHAVAVPSGLLHARPISPEQAVITASRAADARVAALPTLVLPELTFGFEFAKWKIELERPVTFELEDGTRHQTGIVYVGLDVGTADHAALFVPEPVQPTTRVLSYTDSATGERKSIILQVRTGIPVAFRRVQ